FLGGGLLRHLLRRHLLRGLLAEASARRLAGFLDQPGRFLEAQRSRLDVLGNLGVELAVADVRPEAAIEYLDIAVVPLPDDAVARDLFLFLDQEHRALARGGVGVAVLLPRGLGAAPLGGRAGPADADRDRLTVVLAQGPRHLEQLQRLLEGDRVDALPRLERGELRLLLVLDGPHLHQRAVLADPSADRPATGRVVAEDADTAGVDLVQRFLLVLHQLLEGRPEALHQGDPLLLAAADRVELVLHPGGEVVVHVLGEVAGEELAHGAADVGRAEAPAFQLHVLAEQQGGDDRGVGGRTADAVLLQRLDQAGFGEARRWLGEVLRGGNRFQGDPVAGLHGRQLAALVLGVGGALVAALLVHRQEPRIDHRRAGHPERMLTAGRQVDGNGIERGGDHLAGDRALPDQLVEPARIIVQVARDLRRSAQRRSRTHRLVGLLGVLGLRLVEIRLVRDRTGAVITRNDVADLGQCLARQVHRVGSHVADQANGTFLAQRHALVQLLRDLHGA